MARAKHTGRAEARRRYRQTITEPGDAVEGEVLEEEPTRARSAAARPAPSRPGRDAQPAPARPGFGYAFRAAYHPANVREDLRALPRLLRHWSFLLPVALVVGGAAVATVFWNYTGGQLAFQMLVFPGSGFGIPQLAAGFFAPRASYMLGFLVSLIQGVAAVAFAFNIAAQLGTPLTGDQVPTLLGQAFVFGPASGTLFAAAAAWYRRFLALSGPRRPAANARSQSRSSTRSSSGRR